MALGACVADAPPEDDTEDVSDTDDTEAPDTEIGATDDSDPDTGEARPCPRWEPPPRSGAALTASPYGVEVLRRETAACAMIEDLDGDGSNEVVLVFEGGDGAEVSVRYGQGMGPPTEVVATLPLGDRGGPGGCTLADVDDDGDLDVVVGHPRGASALLADGRAWSVRQDVLSWPAEIADLRLRPNYLALLHLDGDGRLDVIASLHGLLRDDCPQPGELDTGDLTIPLENDILEGPLGCFLAAPGGGWTPAPEGVCPSPMLTQPTHAPYAALVADLDDDGHADVVLGNDFSKNRVLVGTGSGLVPWDGVGLDVYNHAMGGAVADLDGDGRRDVYLSDLGPDSVFLSGACGLWFDAGAQRGTWAATRRTVSWGVQGADVDQDGAVDLLVGVGVEGEADGSTVSMCVDPRHPFTQDHPPTLLLVNDGEGSFSRVDVDDMPGRPGPATAYPVLLTVGDVDDDGDLDAVVAHGYATVLLRHAGALAGPAIRVRVEDDLGRPVAGARVVVRTSRGAQMRELWPTSGFQGFAEQVAHVGLGADPGPVTVRVRWPDGAWTTHGPYAPTVGRVTVTRP